MDDVPILGGEEGRELVNQFLGLHGPPAYVRRAVEVEESFVRLVTVCRKKRNEWLEFVRVRLATVYALAGDWEALRPHLSDDGDLERLRQMHTELQPRLRAPVARTDSPRALRRTLAELAESVERFNRRWLEHVAKVDLSGINELRDAYNRYYIVEKECALRSAHLARQGFTPLPPATADDILAELPPLPVAPPRR